MPHDSGEGARWRLNMRALGRILALGLLLVTLSSGLARLPGKPSTALTMTARSGRKAFTRLIPVVSRPWILTATA